MSDPVVKVAAPAAVSIVSAGTAWLPLLESGLRITASLLAIGAGALALHRAWRNRKLP